MQALTLVAPSGPLEQHGVVIGLVEVDESKKRQPTVFFRREHGIG
jgi:hypothetical protein